MTTTLRSPHRQRPLQGLVPPLPVVQFSVDQYEAMVQEGILKQPERCELLNGWIIPKMTHNARHDSAVYRLQRRLINMLEEKWLVRIQSSISIAKSLPEPDLVVALGPESRYDRVRPSPKEIEIVVEVADSTLSQDRGIKKELYAKARIGVYWIVNLVEGQVEVYALPKTGKLPTYRRCEIYVADKSVPVIVGGQTIGSLAVNELVP